MADELEKLREKVLKDADSKLFVTLAEMYRKAGKLDEAVEVLKRGIERQPGYMSAKVALGKIYLEKGMTKEARAEFEQVVQAIPDNLFAQKKLAELYMEMGERDLARKAYKIVVRLNSMDEEAITTLKALEAEQQPVQMESLLEPTSFAEQASYPSTPAHDEKPPVSGESDATPVKEEVAAAAGEDDVTAERLAEEPGVEEAQAADEKTEASEEIKEAGGISPEEVEALLKESSPPEEAVEALAAETLTEAEPLTENITMDMVSEWLSDTQAEGMEPVVEAQIEEAQITEEALALDEAVEEAVAVDEPWRLEETAFSVADETPVEAIEVVEAEEGADAQWLSEAPPIEEVFSVEAEEAPSGILEAEEPVAAVAASKRVHKAEGVFSLGMVDSLVSNKDYASALGMLARRVSVFPDDRQALQRIEELRMLIRLLGKQKEVKIARLEALAGAVRGKKDEFLGNS